MSQFTGDTVLGLIILAVGVFCWIWTFFECRRDENLEESRKKRWLLFIALVPGIGAIFYLLRRRALHRH